MTFEAKALLALAIASCMFQGCSVVGYGIGGAAGAIRKHPIPPSEAGALKPNQYVWIGMDSGERVNGRVSSIRPPDSLTIRMERVSADLTPSSRLPADKPVALSSITALEVPRQAYRWYGLGIGGVADLLMIYFVLTLDHKFHPATRETASP
jgi:hypothetical protein